MEENYMEEKKLKPIQWIYGYCKKHLWTVSLLAGFSALIAGSFILLALVSSRILDIASGNSEGSFLFYTGMLAVIIAFQAVLNILSSNLKVRVSGKLEMQFKQAIFSSILKKSYLEVAKLHSGEIINRLTSDIDILVNGIVGIFPQMISLGTKLIVGLLVLFRIDFSFTFLILTIGMLMCVGSRIYSRKFRYLHKEVQETSGVVRSFLQECIENLVEDYGYFLEEKQIKVELKLGDIEVYIDRKGLEFMLAQILSNSITYLPASAMEKKIVFEAEEKEKEIILSVRDNGIGVKPSDLPFVFEKGFSGDNQEVNKKTTGMGLYLVREMAESLMLTCEARSEYGKGFQVDIRFPVV